MPHDPAIHSKNKLGAVGSVPLLPMMPLAAQAFSPIQVHYKLLGDKLRHRAPALGSALEDGRGRQGRPGDPGD